MTIFKNTVWKWWELKLIALAGLFLGFALGTHLGIYLAQWLWLIWILFIVSWLFVMKAWLKK